MPSSGCDSRADLSYPPRLEQRVDPPGAQPQGSRALPVQQMRDCHILIVPAPRRLLRVRLLQPVGAGARKSARRRNLAPCELASALPPSSAPARQVHSRRVRRTSGPGRPRAPCSSLLRPGSCRSSSFPARAAVRARVRRRFGGASVAAGMEGRAAREALDGRLGLRRSTRLFRSSRDRCRLWERSRILARSKCVLRGAGRRSAMICARRRFQVRSAPFYRAASGRRTCRRAALPACPCAAPLPGPRLRAFYRVRAR